MFTFHHHIKKSIIAAKQKLNLMKMLGGTTWGWDKETQHLTYTSAVRSGMEYGNKIWGPIISETIGENFRQNKIKDLGL